jgi:hypothetical protein
VYERSNPYNILQRYYLADAKNNVRMHAWTARLQGLEKAFSQEVRLLACSKIERREKLNEFVAFLVQKSRHILGSSS